MTQHKRGRGRPPGASRLNDGDAKILGDIAGIIARRPMKPTTAMRQLGITNYAQTKRLQRKWKSDGPALVQAIEDRAQRQREQIQAGATTAYRKLHDFVNSPEIAAAAKAFNQFFEHPAWEELARRLDAAANSPLMKQIADNPQLKRMSDLLNRPEVLRLADFSNSPLMKQIADNPGLMRMNDLQQAGYPSLLTPPRR